MGRKREGHILDDAGAYIPSKKRLWGKNGVVAKLRRSKLYPPEYKTAPLGRAAERIVKTDDHGLPTAD